MTVTAPDGESSPGATRAMRIFGAFAHGSLLRALSVRMIAVSLAALVLLAAGAQALSQSLIEERFRDEAALAADAVRSELGNRVLAARRAAALIAGLPGTSQLITGRARGAPLDPALLNYLRFAKAKLGVDLLNVADSSGAVFATTQDLQLGRHVPADLLTRSPTFEQAFVIRNESDGFLLRALAPIRVNADDTGPPIGYVEDGILLDSAFLVSLHARSDVPLALLSAGVVRASSMPIDGQSLAGQPSITAIDATPAQVLARPLTIAGLPYLGVFSLEQSHTGNPLVLLVLVPLAELQNAERNFLLLLGLLIIGIGIVVIPLAAISAQAFIRPLRRLATSARRVARGDLPVAIARYAPHEIGTLEHAFESMSDAIRERDRNLRDKNAELEQASRLKSEFIANVSHELRTPMNAIIGYSRLILEGLDGDINAAQQADLQRVTAAADRLLSLINELLDLAKIESGKLELVTSDFDLGQLVAEACDLVRPAAEAKSLELRSAIVPATGMFGDRDRIRQVLLNLLANAVKFTEHGVVTVSAWGDDRWTTVSVVDTGIGIRPEQRDFIFDEFRQGDASTTRRYGGTGLGLAICRSLITLHGGRIWVETPEAGGSKFSFSVPTNAPTAISMARP